MSPRAQLRWNTGSGLARANPGGQQSAVALTAADGEFMSGGVQSNFASNGFYGRNGFSRAHDWVGPNPLGGNFAGHDDPNFMPIVTWLTDFVGTGFYARMDDIGLNGMMPRWSSVSLANNVTYGKWALGDNSFDTPGTISSADDPAMTGYSAGEEPFDNATYATILNGLATWAGSSDGPGRYAFVNYADHILNGDFGTSPVITPADMVLGHDNTHTGGTQFTTCDQYWIAGSTGGSNDSALKLHFRLYQLTGSATASQCARGCHYGSMLDSIRKRYSPATPTGMFGVWIEAGAPYTESTTLTMTPAQLKWTVWSTLVHGARSIHYFAHTFRTGDPGSTNNVFNTDYYGGPGIAGTGIYAAAKEVNLRALALAPVINSPFDGYFVWGDLSAIANSGFLTAVTSTNARSQYAGVDACCKWQPTQRKHYIFAITREPEASTNVPVTFRMVDQGQVTATPPYGGSPISVTRGGAIPAGYCEFADTFALASDYKTYRID